MSVNNLYLIGFLLLSFNLMGQEKEIYFLVENSHPRYVFFINGEKELTRKANVNIGEKFFITSTEEYSLYEKEKKNNLKGESYLPGFIFKVKKKKTISECFLNNLCLIDYKWLTENAQIKDKETIELNRFENLHFVFKDGQQCILYKVEREFSSH